MHGVLHVAWQGHTQKKAQHASKASCVHGMQPYIFVSCNRLNLQGCWSHIACSLDAMRAITEIMKIGTCMDSIQTLIEVDYDWVTGTGEQSLQV